MFGHSSWSCWSTECRQFNWCKCRWFYWFNCRWFNCHWFNCFRCPNVRCRLFFLITWNRMYRYVGRQLLKEWWIPGYSAFSILGGNQDSFLVCDWNGSGLNGVDILFCFGCLINTLSPTLKSVVLALLHLSAYSFNFSFLAASDCLISGEASSYCTRGKVDLSFFPFSNSGGDFPVVL